MLLYNASRSSAVVRRSRLRILFICFRCLLTDDPSAPRYKFGVTSLVDPKDTIQTGDNVLFQLAVSKKGDKKRATNVTVIRKPIISHVETMKEEVGWIACVRETCLSLYIV